MDDQNIFWSNSDGLDALVEKCMISWHVDCALFLLNNSRLSLWLAWVEHIYVTQLGLEVLLDKMMLISDNQWIMKFSEILYRKQKFHMQALNKNMIYYSTGIFKQKDSSSFL